MAGKGIATWVKVKNSKGLTPRPISHKYEGGASFEQGQVITQSEYQKLKSEGNKKREETKTVNKEVIANKPKRVKTPEQVSAQSARIIEKTRRRINSIHDKWGQSTDKTDAYYKQVREGREKVATSRKLKSSSEYSDMIKAEKVLRREMASAVGGSNDSQYVKRQKLNKKQIQVLYDKIDDEYGKQWEYDRRIKQLQKLGQNVSSKIY